VSGGRGGGGGGGGGGGVWKIELPLIVAYNEIMVCEKPPKI
jgi:hypothetical protein